MSTNKQAYNKAIVKELSCNYKTVFRRYGYNSLDSIEYEKLYRFLKPVYTYIENDYVIFKWCNQRQERKLMEV